MTTIYHSLATKLFSQIFYTNFCVLYCHNIAITLCITMVLLQFHCIFVCPAVMDQLFRMPLLHAKSKAVSK